MNEFFFAQKAFIVADGMLLAVCKSADDPNQPGLWEVPGGRMSFGEEVDAHLMREVREEVGLEIGPGQPFHVWQWQLSRPGPDGSTRNIQIVAVARICERRGGALSDAGRVEDDFLGEMRWVPISELDTLNWIPNMLPVIDAFRRTQGR